MAFGKPKYIPKRCVFEATLGCNLRCQHCGSMAGKKRSDELSTDEAIDMFGQLAKLGGERITIAGGEPMTRADWPELIEGAVGHGLQAGMITNAIAFDDEAALLAKAKGLNAVGFSVDGCRDVHDRIRGKVGHYERLMRAMESAKRASLPFAVVSFVHTGNFGRLSETHDMIRNKGAFAWQVQLGTDMGNMSDNPELMLEPRDLPRLQAEIAGLIKRRELRIDVSDSIGYFGPHERQLRASTGGKPFGGCPAGMRVIGIESNGNVKGCLSIMAGYNERGADFVEGNIRKRSLEEIWKDPDAFAYNRKWSLERLEGFCGECKHARRCRGGCMAKQVASGDGVENTMCVYRVAMENTDTSRRAGTAAAAVLATMIGGGATQACYETENDPQPTNDAGADAGYDGGADADADSDADTDSDTDTNIAPAYDMPYDGGSDGDADADADADTDADTDTDVTDYGMPEYAMPDYDMPYDAGVEKYAMPQPDGGVDMYSMPPWDDDE